MLFAHFGVECVWFFGCKVTVVHLENNDTQISWETTWKKGAEIVREWAHKNVHDTQVRNVFTIFEEWRWAEDDASRLEVLLIIQRWVIAIEMYVQYLCTVVCESVGNPELSGQWADMNNSAWLMEIHQPWWRSAQVRSKWMMTQQISMWTCECTKAKTKTCPTVSCFLSDFILDWLEDVYSHEALKSSAFIVHLLLRSTKQKAHWRGLCRRSGRPTEPEPEPSVSPQIWARIRVAQRGSHVNVNH